MEPLPNKILLHIFSYLTCHFDGTYSIACGLSYELLFNDKKKLGLPNLKSLILTRFISIESVVQNLCYLIEHQLDEYTLTFHHQVFRRAFYENTHSSMASDIGNQSFI
ncbi:unnamed protein product [Rotaria sp. Silwood1]|nr:unnamed protein product [Rotaria sp. Silwood1]CAF1689431.1 unnamed protein product [Rotaria sp. Silwood1]